MRLGKLSKRLLMFMMIKGDGMHYLKASAVKQLFHESDKQITKDGLHALDTKVDEYLNRIITTFNGHHKRIDAGIIAAIGGVK